MTSMKQIKMAGLALIVGLFVSLADAKKPVNANPAARMTKKAKKVVTLVDKKLTREPAKEKDALRLFKTLTGLYSKALRLTDSDTAKTLTEIADSIQSTDNVSQATKTALQDIALVVAKDEKPVSHFPKSLRLVCSEILEIWEHLVICKPKAIDSEKTQKNLNDIVAKAKKVATTSERNDVSNLEKSLSILKSMLAIEKKLYETASNTTPDDRKKTAMIMRENFQTIDPKISFALCYKSTQLEIPGLHPTSYNFETSLTATALMEI